MFVFLWGADVCQCERMVLVKVQGIVQDVDVVVCPWLRGNLVSEHGNVHANQIGDGIVTDDSLGIPEFPIECQDA